MNELREAFLDKYPKYEIILRMYEQANNVECSFRTLSKPRLRKFVDYMCQCVSRSSARQYAAKFKSVLNLFDEEQALPKGYNKILTVKNEKSVSTYLTDDELKRFSEYAPQSETEKLVQAQFLIGAYTGCRRSDFLRISKENVHDGKLSYVSQKTKTLVTVPLKPMVYKLISDKFKRELSETAFNMILKNICRNAGICESVKVFKAGKERVGEKWQFVSSHTARRSFCTNLYLHGVDLYAISKMAGHASVEMTAQNYIMCGIQTANSDYFS